MWRARQDSEPFAASESESATLPEKRRAQPHPTGCGAPRRARTCEPGLEGGCSMRKSVATRLPKLGSIREDWRRYRRTVKQPEHDGS